MPTKGSNPRQRPPGPGHPPAPAGAGEPPPPGAAQPPAPPEPGRPPAPPGPGQPPAPPEPGRPPAPPGDGQRPGPPEAGQQVVRHRLLGRLQANPVALVEAGAGYGKSVLAWQFRRGLGVAAALVPVGPPDDDPAVLMGSLRRALLASRLSDLAAAMDVADPATAAERLLDTLAQTNVPLLIVLDDAHHLCGQAVTELVLRLARGLPAPHRLLVTARRLAPALEPLRALTGGAHLDTKDLEFTPPEAAALAAGYLGRPPSSWEVNVLLDATKGWATALILAASAPASVGGLRHTRGRAEEMTIAPLLDPIIRLLSPPDRDAVVQLAHLPMLSAEIADAVGGTEGTLHRIIAVGIPFARTPAGWWEMPGPVVSYLTAQHELTARTASTVALVYERRGELLAAVRTLLAARLPLDAARTLAAIAVGKVEDLGLATLRDLIEELPGEAVRENPRVLLHLARLAEESHRADIRAGALARAAALLGAGGAGDAVLRREIDAERARDLMWDERWRAQAKALAAEVVANAAADEITARARALDVLGRLASWFSAEGIRPEAEPLLLESARLARRVGQRIWAAQALVALAAGFYFALCRYDKALATLSEVLAQLPARSIYRVNVQSFLLDILVEQGRFGEAEACVEEMREIGGAYHEEWALAWAGWAEAALASYSGDRERTVRAVLDVEAHRDVWYEQPSGVEFLACACDHLDRVGEHEMAMGLLARAQQRMAGCERPVRVFGAALLARSGDPDEAERAIAETMAAYDLEPQERWPLTLMRAYAAYRRGDPQAGKLAAAAFDLCLELGHPDGPLRRERAVAEALLPLALAAGSRVAPALGSAAATLSITLLGRFEVRRGGAPVDLPPGRPAKAVRAVAAAGGHMHAEELIEILWPDTDPEAGRNRLRNLLSRLRLASGEVLVRDGENIILPNGLDCDAVLFEADARAAIGARSGGEVSRALGLARSAISRYAGDLLPDDRYEDWAGAARERLRDLYVELLDVLAGDAAGRGDVDEAVRLLRRAIEAEPHDEHRYVRLARMLASQGRTGSARTTLERARASLAELGLPPSRPFVALEGELADFGPPTAV
jgi:LuxR family transcriptional regulator, maltose regulon positive regulatory protein